jgi:flagellar biosynthesis protein FlhF
MNLKRFTARTPRDALALVRQAFGDDAVVMSTRPCPEGVEVLAMAPESVQQLERVRDSVPAAVAASAGAAGAPTATPMQPPRRGAFERVEPTFDEPPGPTGPRESTREAVRRDVEQLQMSTLSFQDYVRERMLRRRQAELAAGTAPAAPVLPPEVPTIEQARARQAARQVQPPAAPTAARLQGQATLAEPMARAAESAPRAGIVREAERESGRGHAAPAAALHDIPALHTVAPVAAMPARPAGALAQASAAALPPRRDGLHEPHPEPRQEQRQDQTAMLSELRSMRGLIEQRFGALAFMEKLQRQPRQAQLTQRLLEAGFSPALTRRLAEGLPAEGEEMAWAAGVLERNLLTGERDTALEDAGGVYALIGATGVGKTTSTAKLAAAFAARHGAANLGLVTLDAYRIAAHEQLRTYGRILGVPVHTAHDRASLDDLLELLAGKRLVLIDTAGVGQRDARAREMLEMLQHGSINRLVVVNAAAQGETIEDQLSAYAMAGCRGVVLTKVDEAVKLAPALDAMIRARLKVLAVANGQRVPEDWHRLSAHALVQRALRSAGAPAWRLEPPEVNLIFAGAPSGAAAAAPMPR